MKVVLSWLREFCPTELDAEELADRLTMAGVKVEEITRPWDGLEGVVVGRVIEVSDHPDSEKLCVVRMDTGSGERTVCAGVRNMAAGDLVPYAVPGSRVPALPEPLAPRELRGVLSEGMLCSPMELNLADVHSGILILPEDAPLGVDFKSWLELDDPVLDIEIEPNRPDLMSVVGVAREAASATGVPLTVPETRVDESRDPASEAASVRIDDLDRCPRYLGRVVRGVRVGESPLKVQVRLSASGMRPLSNVVDATNYALLEMGHPLHPFDLHRLDGEQIIVRRAAEGETIETLDGVRRVLTPEDLLIADRSDAVAIAGVMGSAPAEVGPGTVDVLLESAYFAPTGVLRTSRRLGLSTEASMRFERGADPDIVPAALDRAARLVVEWSGGEVLRGYAEAGAAPEKRTLAMRPTRAGHVLGFEVTHQDSITALGRVGIEAVQHDTEIVAEIPGFRVDLLREIDLVEEVVRVEGYDRVRSTLPGVRQAGGMPQAYAFARRIRTLMVRAGLREVRSLSFASEADLALTDDVGPVRVSNPLVADEAFLRTRLAPGLLAALARNRARQVRSAALFEVGTVFRDADPRERRVVGFAMTGPRDAHWSNDGADFDFFDGKGVVESLLEGLGVVDGPRWLPQDEKMLHPVRSASVDVGGERLGYLGELHPTVAAGLDIDASRVVVGELDVDAISRHVDPFAGVEDIGRFPEARRDLAFVVDAGTPAGEVAAVIAVQAGGLGRDVALFDVFSGPPVPDGKKSLAFSVAFRAPDRTLTDEEVDEVVARIAASLAEELDAELRA